MPYASGIVWRPPEDPWQYRVLDALPSGIDEAQRRAAKERTPSESAARGGRCVSPRGTVSIRRSMQGGSNRMRNPLRRDGGTSTMRPARSATRGARTWAPVLLAIAVAALSAVGCTCEGCGDTFRWSAQLPLDVEVRSLSVRSCYNGRCVQASLATVDEDHLRGSGLELVRLTDPADPEAPTGASVMLSRSADALELEVSWYVRAPVDGDRYLVEVADAEGTVLVGFAEQPIDYRSYPVNTLVTYCHTASATGSTVDAASP